MFLTLNYRSMKKLLLTILMVCLIGDKVCAQHWDIHTLQTINNWKVHGLSRGLSDSGLLLPVGIPTAMGIYAFNRQRPYLKYPDRIHLSGRSEDTPSFPSGHTAAAFSLATSLSIAYPKWYVIAPSAVWACGVGFARMNQGVHYPSDVLAGAAIGVGCALVNIYVNKWWNKVLFEGSANKR